MCPDLTSRVKPSECCYKLSTLFQEHVTEQFCIKVLYQRQGSTCYCCKIHDLREQKTENLYMSVGVISERLKVKGKKSTRLPTLVFAGDWIS